ncbi:MAG: hypothetical protein U0640_11745 [Phycisphaerales bacterium]
MSTFAVSLVLGGCKSPMPLPQGKTGVMATYEHPTLHCVLPAAARVPAVIAAAEATVRARGYSVSESNSTEESGVVVARPPRTVTVPMTRISVKRVFQGTKVEITYEPWGDSASSRVMLDGILQRLDL